MDVINGQLLCVIWAIGNQKSHRKHRKTLKPFRPTTLFQKMKLTITFPISKTG